jgi:hypothetical protein
LPTQRFDQLTGHPGIAEASEHHGSAVEHMLAGRRPGMRPI